MKRPASTRTAKGGSRAGLQRGGFFLGVIVGLLAGLALALGVALSVTKVPVPFLDKLPQRGAERFLVEGDEPLTRARLALLAATRQVLRNGLALLGVGAPEAMLRDPAPVAKTA